MGGECLPGVLEGLVSTVEENKKRKRKKEREKWSSKYLLYRNMEQ